MTYDHKNLTVQNIDKYTSLYSMLLNKLPDFISSDNIKEVKNNFKPTYKALSSDKFIRYGTKKVISILIFDDDDTEIENINKYEDFLKSKLGTVPTFITKTKKGFHFGLTLKNPIFKYTSMEQINLSSDYLAAKEIKKSITTLINGDIQGSHRMIGIWRNPLLHEFLYNDIEFSISTLVEKFAKQKTEPKQYIKTIIKCQKNLKLKLRESTKTAKIIKEGFFKGNRNNYLFAKGFKIVFEDRSKLQDIEDILIKINSSKTSPLTKQEVINISKSVKKIEPTMYQSVTTQNVRGRLSNQMWEKRIHGVTERRSYAGKIISKEKRERAISKITNYLLPAYKKSQIIYNAKEIAKNVGLSIRQVQRYRSELTPMRLFKMLIAKPLKDSIEIVIRASVASKNIIKIGRQKLEVLQSVSKYLISHTGVVSNMNENTS